MCDRRVVLQRRPRSGEHRRLPGSVPRRDQELTRRTSHRSDGEDWFCFSLTADGPQRARFHQSQLPQRCHPASGHKGSSHLLSPVLAV